MQKPWDEKWGVRRNKKGVYEVRKMVNQRDESCEKLSTTDAYFLGSSQRIWCPCSWRDFPLQNPSPQLGSEKGACSSWNPDMEPCLFFVYLLLINSLFSAPSTVPGLRKRFCRNEFSYRAPKKAQITQINWTFKIRQHALIDGYL